VAETIPGQLIIQKFKVNYTTELHSCNRTFLVNCSTLLLQPCKDSLLGRENPLPSVNPLATRSMLEEQVSQELQIQFEVSLTPSLAVCKQYTASQIRCLDPLRLKHLDFVVLWYE